MLSTVLHVYKATGLYLYKLLIQINCLAVSLKASDSLNPFLRFSFHKYHGMKSTEILKIMYWATFYMH